MKPFAPLGPDHQDAALLAYVERLAKHREGRRAAHIRLSRLSPRNRRPERLRVAALVLEPLARDFEGSVFRLHNDDLVVVCKGADAEGLARPVAQVCALFARDPLLVPDQAEAPSSLCNSYDVAATYDGLLKLAQTMANAALQAPVNADNPSGAAPQAGATRTIDPMNLSAIQRAIAQADLTGMIRRQAVCAVVPGQPPRPVFYEVFTSIAALREVVIPDVDIHGNRWLFQDLTTHLDRRIISYLAHNDDSTLTRAFSLNLNVASLLTPEFLKFDQALSSAVRRTVVIEVQAVDVLGDLDGFLFARDFLRTRGYRFCLDGLTNLSLPLIDCNRLGVDLVKVQWSEELHACATGGHDLSLRQCVERFGAERVILVHCDSELVFDTGRALGISLFQGFLLDRMLKDTAGRPRAARATA